ncbi:uncharacterized protein [Hemitrygon akajei]|uniref:uncharacterized protein isoform X1 n=1 Tax=Hemitrygon akajei TaxID=2704970 RepID=UPI003BFA38F8
MSDGNLTVGWYRFNSSGGWKIPETVVPQGRCSGETPGWLNGSHPNVGEGEVTRTVCFTWDKNICYQRREIRVKNCSGYFVYWLCPTPPSYAVYCTEPLSDSTQERQGSVTGEPGPGLTTSPAGSLSSDLEASTLDQSTGLSTGEHTQELSSVPAGDTSSDSLLDTTQEPQVSPTGKHGPGLTTTPAGSASSDLETSTLEQSTGLSTGEHTQELSSIPAGDTSSDSLLDTTWEPQVSPTGKHGLGLTTTPTGSASSGTDSQPDTTWEFQETATGEPDLETSTLDQSTGLSTGEHTQELSSVPAGDTSSDFHSDITWESLGTSTREPGPGFNTTTAGSSSSHTDLQSDTTCEPDGSVTDLEASTMDQPDGSSTGQPTPSPSSVSAGERSSDSLSDTTQEPQGSATGGPGPGLSTTPAGSASSDPGRRTSPNAGQEKPTDTTCKASEMIPVNGLLSDEECEEMINSAQVLFIGQNNLGDPQDREAYLNQIHEILREQLPCKHNLSKSKRDKGNN